MTRACPLGDDLIDAPAAAAIIGVTVIAVYRLDHVLAPIVVPWGTTRVRRMYVRHKVEAFAASRDARHAAWKRKRKARR